MNDKRLLAIDYGEKRIGLAVTDPLNIFAYPLVTLPNDARFFTRLKKIIDEYGVKQILLGYPLKENGAKSRITGLIDIFKQDLEIKFGLLIELVDERYSSEIARQRIIETTPSRKKRRDKSLIDKNAAAVMLEDYISSQIK